MTLHGEQLRTEFRVINTGDAPFSFTPALHTYIEVLDIQARAQPQMTVTEEVGFDGLVGWVALSIAGLGCPQRCLVLCTLTMQLVSKYCTVCSLSHMGRMLPCFCAGGQGQGFAGAKLP